MRGDEVPLLGPHAFAEGLAGAACGSEPRQWEGAMTLLEVGIPNQVVAESVPQGRPGKA